MAFECGTLEVHLVRAEELVVPAAKRKNWSSLLDPVCQLRVCSPSKCGAQQKSSIQWKSGAAPVWNQSFFFGNTVLEEDELLIEVLDASRLMAPTPLGTAKFTLAEVMGSGFEREPVPLCLPVVSASGEDTGYLRIQLSFSSDFPEVLQSSGLSGLSRPSEWGRCATLFTLRSTRMSYTGIGPIATRSVSDATCQLSATSRLSNPKLKSISTPGNMLSGKGSGLQLDQRILPEEHTGDCWAEFDDWSLLERGDTYVMYSATLKTTGQEYCLKQFSKQPMLSSQAVVSIQQEVQVMQALSCAACPHDNIITLIDMFEDNASVCLVLEMCSGSDLFEAILAHGQYSEADAANMMRTIVTTLAYIHSAGIMHRDIRPETMAFKDHTDQAGLKFTNLGAAVLFEEGQQMTEPAATLLYAAPEVLKGSYGKEADLWACGVLLFTLLCGRMPYEGVSEEDVLEAITQEPITMDSPVWGHVSDAAKECVLRLMDPDPATRATPAQILKHPWLSAAGCAPSKPLDMGVVNRVQDFVRMSSLKKEALKVIALSRPLEELKALREEFLSIDEDKSGSITHQEFVEALRRAGQNVQDMSSDVLNGCGQIFYDDFLAAMLDTAKSQRDEDLRRAFEHFDIDKNGRIDVEELKKVFAEQDRWGLTAADAEDMIKQYDKDGDNEIDFTEFAAMLRGV